MKVPYRIALSLTVGMATLTACGTTVPLSQQVASQGTGLGDSTDPGALATSGTSGTTGTTTGGSTTGGTAGTSTGTTTGAAPTVGPTSSSALPTAGPTTGPVTSVKGPQGSALGITPTTIKLGVFTVQGFSSFASSAGFSASTGDQVAEAKVVINYINAHGGIAGRRIIPVFHDLSVTGAATNVDNEYQAACAAWTQDDHVYAVISAVGTVDNTLYECLKKKGVPTIAAGDSQDASFFQQFPDTYYQPADMNLRRIFTNSVDALFGAGFYGSKPKIGVVLADSPTERAAVSNGLKPALAKHGLSLADTFQAPTGANVANAYQSAVLQFKAHGVTHVMFSYLGSPLLFMNAANTQGYHPRYALHSRLSPAALLQGSAPKAQQSGAMGIGWQPMNDVDGQHDPGSTGARQKLCLSLMKQAGQDTSARSTALIGLWVCDNLFFMREALVKAPNFTLAGLRQGAEAVGRFDAASTFQSNFAPGRLHDGAGAFRLFAWVDSCSCYQYTSPLRPAA